MNFMKNMKIKLTRNDIEKVLPPQEREEAIKQSERYEKEYEISKKRLDELLSELEKLMKDIEQDTSNDMMNEEKEI